MATAAATSQQMVATDLANLLTPVAELTLLPGNPRRGDVEAIAASLARFGQRKPVVAKRDGTVIAGNHTLEAARSLGWERIAVVRVDDDDTMAHAYALADNRTAELGGYDDQALADLIGLVYAEDAALLEATGWAPEDLTELLARLEPAPVVNDPGPGEPPEEPRTRLGDLYELGAHRLLCGDATVLVDVERLTAGQPMDLLWTDPPYGVDYASKNAALNAIAPANRIQTPIIGDAGTPEQMTRLWIDALGNAATVLRPGASFYVAGPAQAGLLLLLLLAIRDSGLGELRQEIVWVKNNHVLGRSDYNGKHEPILYGWKPGAAHSWFGGGGEVSTWEIDRPHASDLHPTMKPVALIDRSLANSTTLGARVLDLFGGSGSTLIACEQASRIAYLMELSPAYCDVIVDRWEQATGQTARLLDA